MCIFESMKVQHTIYMHRAFIMLKVYNGLILDHFHYLLTWQQQLRIGTQDSLTLSLP